VDPSQTPPHSMDCAQNQEVLRMAVPREWFGIVKVRKISYLGHILRGATYSIPKLILQCKIEGKRCRHTIPPSRRWHPPNDTSIRLRIVKVHKAKLEEEMMSCSTVHNKLYLITSSTCYCFTIFIKTAKSYFFFLCNITFSLFEFQFPAF